MPAPDSVRPSQVKNLIPSSGGGFCDKFLRFATGLGQTFYDLVLYEIGEDGLPTAAFKKDICDLGCVGSGTGGGGVPINPDMPAPTGLTASDDAFSDKIRVDWTGSSVAAKYRVYRSLETNDDPSLAALIATVDVPSVEYDDTTAIPGTKYRYWARASDSAGSELSAFSNGDLGRAASSSGSLTAISDLRATIGFRYSFVALVWTPPAGATAYDIYRGTLTTFADATKIYADVVPASTNLLSHPTMNPTCWDNTDEILLYDTPPSASTDYYYWAVPKKSSPPSVGPESNSAQGRVNAPAIYNLTDFALNYSVLTCTIGTDVPNTATKMRVIVFPSGGGGAGGNSVYGAGGGGGGGLVVETFTVTNGDVMSLVITGAAPDTGNAASTVAGTAGALLTVKKNGVSKMTSTGGHGGLFNAAGGGAGGAGDTGTGTATPTIYAGHAGMPGSGTAGGRSGYWFSSRRMPCANGAVSGGYTGNAFVGSGASAVSFNPSLSIGGSGLAGSVLLQFGT